MKKKLILLLIGLVLSGCVYALPTTTPVPALPAATNTLKRPTSVVSPAPSQTPVLRVPTATATVVPNAVDFNLPNFDHIALIVLENEYLQNVFDDGSMPNLIRLASGNVLLSNYSAITHPSLPNYLALISGSTQNITDNCMDCYVDRPNLADEIEASGRIWKAYFEDMPSPCFLGSDKPYVQIFNPFIYFNSIRLNPVRCTKSVVPLTELDGDLSSAGLPNFIYISPNQCHSGHDCSAAQADEWLGAMVAKLQASPAFRQNSLIIVTFDEGVQSTVPVLTHGEVATVLISPMVRAGYVDETPYSHYSLLKTILLAWDLPPLGETSLASVNLIADVWVDQIGMYYPRALTPHP